MRIAVTGADGFLGWHTRCALRARAVDEVVPVGRARLSEPSRLDDALRGADAVLHLAGANRADSHALREGNIGLAESVTASLNRLGARPVVVFANSIQSGNCSPFGLGKEGAAAHLAAWGASSGAIVADVRLPNLFGEHGRPYYNSVVATFCHELSNGGTPTVADDRLLPLLHVQDAVDLLLGLLRRPVAGGHFPPGRPIAVSEVLSKLQGFRRLYGDGSIPDIADPFDLALFNTYRSFCFPASFPLYPALRTDDRGSLFACVSGQGVEAHVFCSSTHPGATRGEHFHLRKVERFLVLQGRAQIALRKLFDNTVVRFEVTGSSPAIVDMPTMWAHSITNTGPDELITLFWANRIFDPADSDTYPERTELGAVPA